MNGHETDTLNIFITIFALKVDYDDSVRLLLGKNAFREIKLYIYYIFYN